MFRIRQFDAGVLEDLGESQGGELTAVAGVEDLQLAKHALAPSETRDQFGNNPTPALSRLKVTPIPGSLMS